MVNIKFIGEAIAIKLLNYVSDKKSLIDLKSQIVQMN